MYSIISLKRSGEVIRITSTVDRSFAYIQRDVHYVQNRPLFYTYTLVCHWDTSDVTRVYVKTDVESAYELLRVFREGMGCGLVTVNHDITGDR